MSGSRASKLSHTTPDCGNSPSSVFFKSTVPQLNEMLQCRAVEVAIFNAEFRAPSGGESTVVLLHCS